MTTVLDHVRPWLIPNSTLAAMIQFQSGAYMNMKGHRNANDPTRDQQVFPAKAIGQRAGIIIGNGFRNPEDDNEGEYGRSCRDGKLLLCNLRQNRTLESHHSTNKAVDDNKQGELLPVFF